MNLITIVTLLVAAAATASAGATPGALGTPRFVQLTSIEGLPPDSLARGQFLDAFRGVFAEEQLDAEKLVGEEWRPGLRFSNRFRLLEGFPADDAWTLQIVVGAPPAVIVARRKKQDEPQRYSALESRRMSRGMTLSMIVLSPEARANGARPRAMPFGFAFPAAAAPEGSSLAVPARGYVFPWDEAGRATGRLALELLHRDSGELGPGDRFLLSPAVRTPSGR